MECGDPPGWTENIIRITFLLIVQLPVGWSVRRFIVRVVIMLIIFVSVIWSVCILQLCLFMQSGSAESEIALNHHKAVGKEFLAEGYNKMHQYKQDEFIDVHFRGRSFYVNSKGIDIINWVLQGREGEGHVSDSFEKILRVGRDEHFTEETGYCTRAHREKNGNKHAIFLDIGANAGFYGLYAAACGCRTYFFDVQDECHEWISSAIDRNRFHHAALIPFPVGNVSEIVHIPNRSNGCWGTFSFSKNNKQVLHYMLKDESEDIRMVKIDEVFDPAMKEGSLGPIAAIKIDVEGFEIGIIAGMREILRHTQPDGKGTVRNVLVEMSPTRWGGVGISRQRAAEVVVDVLWDAGFQGVTCFGNRDWDSTHFKYRHGLIEWIAVIEWGQGVSNDFEFKRTHNPNNLEEEDNDEI